MEKIKTYVHTLRLTQHEINVLLDMISEIADKRKVKKADRKEV